MRPVHLWKSLLLAAATAVTGTIAVDVPSVPIQLESYTYSENVFAGRIFVQNIAYTKEVNVFWSDASDDWNDNGNSVAASYSESIADTNYEYWEFSTTIGSAGISQSYLRYDVSGSIYYDNNDSQNYDITETSTPTTTTAAPTSTTSTPTTTTDGGSTTTTTATSVPTSTGVPEGNATISEWASAQLDISWPNLMMNVNPSGAVTGSIVASLSTSNPDYFYIWTRDAAMVARVMVYMYNTTEAGDTNLLNALTDYVTFSISSMNVDTVCDCLGEPKFNVDGSGYTGAWGRPQNDGPAERASTMILIADSYIAQGGDVSYVTDTLKPAIYTDLDYVVDTWSNVCFDLWEEVNGIHMYTLSVMRKALLDGANFATRNGDTSRVSGYESTASSIKTRLESFWSSSNNYITVTQSFSGGVSKAGLDVSTLIAANLASMNDGFYTPGSDEILATAVAIENSFISEYTLNQNRPSWLSTAIGRYPEDSYDGYGNSQGNPWFIATATYAELYYRAILEWQQQASISVNSVNLGFFSKFDSDASVGTVYTPGTEDFANMVSNVAFAADEFLATIENHSAVNGSLSEQYNRDTGIMQGARDLTWSHAAFITAAKAKQGAPIH
ncbi:glucoamylase precursor [Zychaea mexicana]|uniref:glucoamylase precursor n=1 Tax=Zychaea mexicana TaxID=64656 RepID=UPI0022FF2EC2|nr:glucoamylase precursor [Zychaea mexicana]KAI9493573.1 glucoamylase precursor [Zychaea mexicana]